MAFKTLLTETQKLMTVAAQGSSFVKDDICKSIHSLYNELSTQEKNTYLKDLAKNHSITKDQITKTDISKLLNGPDAAQHLHQLRTDLVPAFRGFFVSFGRIPDGVKFLVDLRADVLNLQHSRTVPASPAHSLLKRPDPSADTTNLPLLDNELSDLLGVWFSAGLLHLQRITWDSPCSILQRVSDLEAVHKMRNWTDLKRRVGSYRRCYVFTHPCMPSEPVVILHTALTSELATSMNSIVPRSRASVDHNEDVQEDPSQIKAAMFYSVSSPHKGLMGIDLGHSIIKRVVSELQLEFPGIDIFSSLSPIPGFKKWLLANIDASLHKQAVSRVMVSMSEMGGAPQKLPTSPLIVPGHLEAPLCAQLEVASSQDLLSVLKIALEKADPQDMINMSGTPMEDLMKMWCAHYLTLAKQTNGYAKDTVCNFHLRNGAVVWKVNWLANMTSKGIQQSFGLMVNYRYFLEKTEVNSRGYLEGKTVVLSDEVTSLLNTASPKL